METEKIMNNSDYFNSGVMVLTPSIREFRDMEKRIAITPSYDNGDQGFLNEYYKTNWVRLSYIYNAQQPDYISNKLQWDLGMSIFFLSIFNLFLSY
jgi:lipopolysaccharide biosynthesis glycosyltransferase